MIVHTSYFLILIAIVAISLVHGRNIPQYEYDALWDLYNSTNGASWQWDVGYGSGTEWSFYPGANPCLENWQGITCVNSTTDETLEYVQLIDLIEFNMTGTIPPSIGNFSKLITLDLDTNNIHGSIPTQISNLLLLFTLRLNNNLLTGSIPESLYGMPDLEYLVLYQNKLDGSISPKIGNLTSLVGLRFDVNELTGTIPPQLSNCSNLAGIILSGNKLHGTIPPELGTSFPAMTVFLVDNNQLTGSIPPQLMAMCDNNYNLLGMGFNNNKLNGTIPATFNNCSSMQTLDLSNNSFSGSLPLLTSHSLRNFYVGNNQLTGSIPTSHAYIAAIQVMDLSNNMFNGSIPALILDNYNIRTLLGYSNQFTGSLVFGTLCQFVTIDLFNNSLTGTLSSNAFNYYAQTIDLSNNYLQGAIPSDIEVSYNLIVINLDYNSFDESIPEIFVNFTLLQSISLSNNALTGEIPAFETQYGVHLEQFDVHSNYLEGTIPPSLLSSFSVLLMNLGDNLLTGTIPGDAMAEMKSVSGISLYDNLLTGTIPWQLSLLSSIQLVFVDMNMLTGDISSAFDGSQQLVLKYVDVSNNRLHGTIPTSAFKLPSLLSFAAVSNCLYGSLPNEEICALTNLTTLAMDGLETASVCQYIFFNHLPYVDKAYGLRHDVTGGLDACLFNMPKLETLHLSGNAISGSIPEDMLVSESLQDLSLSHNLLTGTIPLNIQLRPWLNLDLSYNKLHGGLSHSFPALADNASLSLEVNRLSGVIPHSLKYAKSINILDGNLFKCDTERSQLPVNDRNQVIYECGSNTFNYAIYIWLVLCSLVVIFFVVLIKTYSDEKQETINWLHQLYTDSISWMKVFAPTDGREYEDANIMSFVQFVNGIRFSYGYIVLFIVAILMPIYIALSFIENTYAYEYAWTVSAVYLSGLTSTIIMMLCFAALGIVSIVALFKFIKWGNLSQAYTISIVRTCPALLVGSFAAVFILNIALVTTVNILYVYIHVTYNASIVYFTQFCLAMFKLIWNNWAVRELLGLTKRFEMKNQENWLVTSRSKFGRQRIGLEVLMILFNNLGAPFIATALVSSDCFYNIIAAPPKVAVSYSYSACITSDFYINGSTCLAYDSIQVVSTDYEPPFLYSFQCGSTFISTYATIYVFMFIIAAFLAPLAFAIGNTCYRNTSADSKLHYIIGSCMPKILKLTTSLNLVSKRVDSFANNPRLEKLVNSTDSDFKVFEYNVVFHCDLFVVKVINMFAMIVTFGAILPPLAVVGFVAIFNFTYYTQLLIGRYIVKAGESDKIRIAESINRDCEHASDLFMNSVWIVLPFATIFYSILVLDTLGNSIGWHAALWAPIVTMSVPIAIWLCRKTMLCFFKGNKVISLRNKKDSFFEDHQPNNSLTEYNNNSLTENPLAVQVGIVGKL